MNPWHDARLLNMAANALFALVLAACLAAALWWASQRPMFDLRLIEVEPRAGESLRHVSGAVLRATVTREIRGNFFTMPLATVQAVFETVPWVRRANVRRIWPDGLIVEVEEHRPLALWGDGRLVNTFGELFLANLGEAEDGGPLPQFSGPPGSEVQVARRFAELRQLVAPLGQEPVAISLSDRHAWSLTLADGTSLLLGRERGTPIDQRLTRWVETYPRVMTELSRRAAQVDLRYPNGYAIRSLAMLDDASGVEEGTPGAGTPAAAPTERGSRAPRGATEGAAKGGESSRDGARQAAAKDRVR